MKRSVAYALAGVEVFLLLGTAEGTIRELYASGWDLAAAATLALYASLTFTTVLTVLYDCLRFPSDVRID